jgi:hypothetical protein
LDKPAEHVEIAGRDGSPLVIRWQLDESKALEASSNVTEIPASEVKQIESHDDETEQNSYRGILFTFLQMLKKILGAFGFLLIADQSSHAEVITWQRDEDGTSGSDSSITEIPASDLKQIPDETES